MGPEPLQLSVVMPVRDGAEFLARSLAALRASDLPASAWELIVVDDGSRDGSADLAARQADRVVQVAAPASGPPSARNRGAAVARAPLVVFVDADVAVHRDALRRIRDLLSERPDVTAVFGAYDLNPSAPDLVSQYRNLLHTYVHRRDAGEAVTFWTGLGAVRREVLERCGGFDERERLDDVEFGYRIASCGHRILLDPRIQGAHLKRWTLANVITTDIVDRGVPWMRLLLRGRRPRGRTTLNLRALELVLTALTGIAILAGGLGVFSGESRWLLGAGFTIAGVVGADWKLHRWLGTQRGWQFVLGAVPLRLLYFALNVVAVGLALLPVGWSRKPARQARVPTGRRPTGDCAEAKPPVPGILAQVELARARPDRTTI